MTAPEEPSARRTTRIDLATVAPFQLGGLAIDPPSREVRAGEQRAVVEPRVLQVLVALAQAEGQTLSRDVLVQRCWEGRAVGEDAIQRAVAKARRLADLSDPPAFAIESIARVGYRLSAGDASAPAVPAFAPPRGVDRRLLLAGGGAAAVAAGGGAAWLLTRRPAPSLPAEAQALLDQGRDALRDGTPDRNASALALLRRATEAAPGSAETWGALALGYAVVAGRSAGAEAAPLGVRTGEAARRALALDRDNADAVVSTTIVAPAYLRWLAYEQGCRAALARFPAHGRLNQAYGDFLVSVGRNREAQIHYDRALAASPLEPQLAWRRVFALWCSGRLDEADAAMDHAFALWPRHYAIWHVRFRLLAYTGRVQAALAQVADEAARPIGEPDWNFKLCRSEANAVQGRQAAAIDATLVQFEAAMTRGLNHAVNGFEFASTVGRLDRAFAYADAYFFGRGLKVAEAAYSSQQGIYYPQSRRIAWHLFRPNTAAARHDPRFEMLLRQIGLEDYWARSGTKPDFRA